MLQTIFSPLLVCYVINGIWNGHIYDANVRRDYIRFAFWLNRKIKQKSIDEHMFMRYYIYNFGGDESGLYSNEL